MMANNLKKIKGLTFSRELSDRVGVAMFLHAKSINQEGEDTPEKRLAQWALSNPMGTDNTMLALVATDTTVVESASIITTPVANNRTAGPPANVGNATYAPADVSLDEVSDEAIEAAVAENWSTVAQKFVVPEPVNESVTVIPGDVRNPFLGALPDDSPTPPLVEEQLIRSKKDQ